jgi:serine phosphatase RsbU (regulator of sigma subunit)
MRPLAALCMVWAAEDLTWFAVELTGIPIPGVPDLFQTWGSTLLEARGLTSACVLAALLALLFRDQRQVSNERAQLAGELDAARMIQQRLVPIELPAVTGLRIAAAYLPAAEVGGDFYQIFEQPDGASLIIVGDVSGKGLKAAMTGALAIGALRALAEEAICPAELLRRLNRQVLSAQDNSFITCLCARIARDGSLVLANAGHLAPYCNGDEVELESGLPLGIVPDVDFIETALQLAPGDTLTLLSDGVVEAMNEERELFGFERTRAISRQTARSIADAAQQFGQPQPQNDDITVLTLTFAPAEMVYA